MQDRRKFLATTASSLAALGVVGQASADDAKVTKEEINQAAVRGNERNGSTGIKRELMSLGLNPDVTTDTLGSDNVVSPDRIYGDPSSSDSELTVSVSDNYQDDYVYVSVTMDLKSDKYIIRNSWWCDDAIGIGFNKSDWAAMGEPAVSATTEHDAGFTAQNVSDDALAGTVDIKRQDLDFEGAILPDATVSLTGEFKLREGGEPTTLWGTYSHTVAPSPSGSIKSISGGYGGLGLTVSLSSAVIWSQANPQDASSKL